MQRIAADVAVSVCDLKKSPTAIVDESRGAPVAILNHNRVVAYMVHADTFEAMLERLDDQALIDVVDARADEQGVPVSLDDL
jgi:antitoxin StbD